MASVTYLMSYPGPDWHIRGAQNFRSKERKPANPRQAFKEWLGLCDAITRAGGHILVMPPPAVDPPLTGMIYTANTGQLFGTQDRTVYLLSSMSVAHRQAEREFARPFLVDAGLKVQQAQHVWEGQADLQLVAGNRFIATWGVRTVRESLDEIRSLLPPGSHLLDLQIRDPYFHGDTCLNAITTKGGHDVLLVFAGALVGLSLEGLRGYVGTKVDVYPIEEDDALNYACNALCVNGTLLCPQGLSTTLRGHLLRRGFLLEELELGELFGKGGGGPRCLVNVLRGVVTNTGAPDYASQRDELYQRAEKYPEKYEPPAPQPPPSPQSPPVA